MPRIRMILFYFCIFLTQIYSLHFCIMTSTSLLCPIKVYSSLDYESRFFGKEIIDNFGNRLGRSVCSIGLILYTKYIKEIDSSTLSVLTFICASSWFLSGVGLSRLVLTREEYRNISISSKRISEKSDGEEIVEKDKAQ